MSENPTSGPSPDSPEASLAAECREHRLLGLPEAEREAVFARVDAELDELAETYPDRVTDHQRPAR